MVTRYDHPRHVGQSVQEFLCLGELLWRCPLGEIAADHNQVWGQRRRYAQYGCADTRQVRWTEM